MAKHSRPAEASNGGPVATEHILQTLSKFDHARVFLEPKARRGKKHSVSDYHSTHEPETLRKVAVQSRD